MQLEQTAGVKHLLQWIKVQGTQVLLMFSTDEELQTHF